MISQINLKTDRLLLRRLTPDDAGALFCYRSLPDVSRYQSFHPSAISDAAKFIDTTANQPDIPGTWYQLGIFEKNGATLIGDIGIHFLDSGEVELGCTLAPGSQGQGCATEAAAAVFEYIFQSLGKRRAIFSVDPHNAPSRSLATRLGMRQVTQHEKSFLIDREWCDDVIYEANAVDWMAKRPGTRH
jgi:RimJ/RimL family protein N-acetyltransferase